MRSRASLVRGRRRSQRGRRGARRRRGPPRARHDTSAGPAACPRARRVPLGWTRDPRLRRIGRRCDTRPIDALRRYGPWMRAATLSIDVRAGEVDGNLDAGSPGSAPRRTSAPPWPFCARCGRRPSPPRPTPASSARARKPWTPSPRRAAASGSRSSVRPTGRGAARASSRRTAPRPRRGPPRRLPRQFHLFTPTAEHLAFRAGSRAAASRRGRRGRGAGQARAHGLLRPALPRRRAHRVPRGAELLTVSAQWPRVRGPHAERCLGACGRALLLRDRVQSGRRIAVVGRRAWSCSSTSTSGAFAKTAGASIPRVTRNSILLGGACAHCARALRARPRGGPGAPARRAGPRG